MHLGFWNPKAKFQTLTEAIRLMGERMNGKGGSSSLSSSSLAMVKFKCDLSAIMFTSRSVNHPRKRF